MVNIELIEQAMIDALSPITELKMVESHQGEVAGIREGSMLVNMPAVLVEYAGARVNSERARDSVRCKVDVSFTVFVIGKNLKGAKEASADVRAILQKVREKLNGLIYEKKIMLLWQSEELTYITGTGICIYQQIYQYTDYLTQTTT